MSCFAAFAGFGCWDYWLAQCFGGLVGAAVVYALYAPVIDHFLSTHAAAVFPTHLGTAITALHGFTDPVIETAVLIFGVFAITDKYNDSAPRANSGALLIGLWVALIGGGIGAAAYQWLIGLFLPASQRMQNAKTDR